MDPDAFDQSLQILKSPIIKRLSVVRTIEEIKSEKSWIKSLLYLGGRYLSAQYTV